MVRGDKGYQRRKAATAAAQDKDAAAKEALQAKMSGKAYRLTRAELRLAKRTGEGEGQK